jgi:uncharacterized protein (DUF983 family)
MTSEDPNQKGQPGMAEVALFGLCPACGERTLFEGMVQFAPKCGKCGLEIEKFNVGDGPAAFLTLIIGAVIVALAIWLDFAVRPPFWVHALIWIPATAGMVVLGLRASKAALLQAEFARNAREATGADIEKPDET